MTDDTHPGWDADEVRGMLDAAAWLIGKAWPAGNGEVEPGQWYAGRDDWWAGYRAWQADGRPLVAKGEAGEPVGAPWEIDPVSRRIGVLTAMNVRSPEPAHFVQPIEFGEAVARAGAVLDEWVATGEIPHHPLKPIREYLIEHRPGALENYGDPVHAILAQVDWTNDQVHRLRGALARPEYQTEMAETFGVSDPMAMAATQVVDAVVKMLHGAADLIRDHKVEQSDEDKEEQAAEQLAEGAPVTEIPDDWR